MPQRHYAWPNGHWDWYQHLAFKHGIRVGEFAFVGGQVDKSSAGEPLHAYDLSTQSAVVIGHIDTVLREFGSGLADVVKLVAFYATDGHVDESAFLAELGRHVSARCETPDGEGPAITLVPLPCLALPGMMVEIEAIAMIAPDGKRFERAIANLPDLAPLPPPFNHGVRCGDHLWTSALRCTRDGIGLHTDDLVAQSAATLEHIARVLGALGADLNDTVKLSTWYRGDGTHTTWEPAARKWTERFAASGPAVSTLPTPSLPPGVMTQVDAWAMQGTDGNRLARTYAPGHWPWPDGLKHTAGLQCGGLVFVSQQVALDTNGNAVVPGDLKAQTQQVMASTRDVLMAFGLTLDDMVKQNSFYQGKADPETIVSNQRYRSSFYREPAGTSTGVPLPCLSLHELMVSVETIAMISDART